MKTTSLIVLFTIFLVGCNALAQMIPTSTATSVPTITSTKIPTNTPLPPTSTNTPTLTPTPTLTSTPTLTPTPIGGGWGKIVFYQEEKTSQTDKFISNLFFINVDGTDLGKLTDNSSTEIDFYFPVVSPDGKWILYSRGENNNNYWKYELFLMKTDGSGVQKISPAPQYKGRTNVVALIRDAQGSWSPDGKFVVFASNRHSMLGQDDDEIHLMNLENFEIKQLTNASGKSQHPSWSPDGTKIIFMSDRDGDWEIYSMDVDGRGVKQLTKNRSSDRFPSWSPDGKRIIYHSDRDGNNELYLMIIETLEETRITSNPADDFTGRFSPDGQWIAFSSDRDGDDDL